MQIAESNGHFHKHLIHKDTCVSKSDSNLYFPRAIFRCGKEKQQHVQKVGSELANDGLLDPGHISYRGLESSRQCYPILKRQCLWGDTNKGHIRIGLRPNKSSKNAKRIE